MSILIYAVLAIVAFYIVLRILAGIVAIIFMVGVAAGLEKSKSTKKPLSKEECVILEGDFTQVR